MIKQYSNLQNIDSEFENENSEHQNDIIILKKSKSLDDQDME